MTTWALIAVAAAGWAGWATATALCGRRTNQLAKERVLGRVALAEVERWQRTAQRIAGHPLPKVGLPWSYVDSGGDGIRIDAHPDGDDAVVVSTRWAQAQGLGVHTSATLDTYQQRLEAAAAILTVHGQPDSEAT